MGEVTSCAMCGARLEWDPGEATLACPHCGTVNERTPAPSGPWGIETADLPEHDLQQAIAALATPEVEESVTVACPGCGAEISFDAQTLAEDCPFCATPLARAETHTHRHPETHAVLPFALDERQGKAAMAKWLGGLWFAPSDLSRYAQKERPLSGVYLPHYTYDARAEADYRGQRGDAYWVTRGSGKNAKRIRRVRWRGAQGTVRRAFDDVLVPASDTLAEGGGEGLTGWDLQALEPYASRFLAGFRAEMPTLDLKDGWQRATGIMEDVLREDVRRDIGGDEQRINSLRARYDDVTFKHVLLPVWLAAYRYRGRGFRVVVNARTGKAAGQRPWSPWKIALAAIAALFIAVAAAWIWSQSR